MFIPSSLSDDISNISSINFKRKLIPPPSSVIATVSISTNMNDSSICSTSKLMTSTSDIEHQKHSLALTPTPISEKPQVLKSILKPFSNLSSSKSSEIRKAVHIMATNSSINSRVNQTFLSNDQKKSINQSKTHMNKCEIVKKNSINSNFIITTKKSLETVKRTPPVSTKTTQQFNKTSKNKSSSSLKSFQQNKALLSKKTSVSTTEKSKPKTFKREFMSQTNICMYDRIKERSRNEQNPNR